MIKQPIGKNVWQAFRSRIQLSTSFQFETTPLHHYGLAVIYDRKLNASSHALLCHYLYLKQKPVKAEERYRTYVKQRIEELRPSSNQ